MGLILDSTVFIHAERQGETVRQMLSRISNTEFVPFQGKTYRLADEEIGVSVISLMELAHGIVRADTPQRLEQRARFLSELKEGVPIYPITEIIALNAGHIDGDLASKGMRIALSDLLIGVTALDLGWAVGTANERHFKMIPDLKVFVL